MLHTPYFSYLNSGRTLQLDKPVLTPGTVRPAVTSHNSLSLHGPSHKVRSWLSPRCCRFLNSKPSFSAKKSLYKLGPPQALALNPGSLHRSAAAPPSLQWNLGTGQKTPATGGACQVDKWYQKAMCSAAMVHVVNHRYAVRSHLAIASDKRCALSCGGASFTNVTPAYARRHGAYEAEKSPSTSWPFHTGQPSYLHSGRTVSFAEVCAAAAVRKQGVKLGCFTGPCSLRSDPAYINTGFRLSTRCAPLGRGALSEVKHFGPWLQLCAQKLSLRRKALVTTVRVLRLTPIKHKRMFVLAPDSGGQPQNKAPGHRDVHGTLSHLAVCDDVRSGDDDLALAVLPWLHSAGAKFGRAHLSLFGPFWCNEVSTKNFLRRLASLDPHWSLFGRRPRFARRLASLDPSLGFLVPHFALSAHLVRTKQKAARDSWCLSTRYALSDGASLASGAQRTVLARSARNDQPISLQYVRFAHEVLLGCTGNPHVAKLLRSLVSRFVGRRLQLRVTGEALELLRAKLSAPNKPSGSPSVLIGGAPQGRCKPQPLGDTRGEYVPFLGYLICHGYERETRPLLRSPKYQRPTDFLSAPKKVLAHPRLRNRVRLLVNMPKVLNSLAEQGFCDRSGNPQPNFHYFQETQSDTVTRVASVLRGLANYYHLAESQRRCVSRWSYILTHSLAMMFAAKFKLGTRAKVFALAGRNLWKPLLAKSRLRDSSASKHTVPARAGQPRP
jgi:Type II intron maturase